MAGIVRRVFSSPHSSPVSAPSRWLPAVLCVALAAGQLLLLGSLMVGRDTLYLRDVLQTHGAFEVAREREWTAGRPAMVDPYRAGGQPRWGNPNALPFYPTGALYAVAPRLWSLNAHLWLHVLLAPWGLAWLGRRLGLGRPAALAGGVFYGLSGFVLSHLGFANLVVGAALAPAFAAACLAISGRATPGRILAVGTLWCLLLLGGDPLYAVLGLAVAAVAWLGGASRAMAPERQGSRTLVAGLGALAAGTLVAAPQIGELLRILPSSRRGMMGFDHAARTLASWDPRQAVEWLLPLVFGRIDRLGEHRFWGEALHPGGLPLFLSLAPGVLVLALAAGAGWSRRASRVGWLLVAVGLLFALGRFNPLLASAAGLPGLGLVRFPVKAWLLVAPGLALLGAAGWQAVVIERDRGARRKVLVALSILSLTLVALLGTAWMGSGMPGPGDWIPSELGAAFRAAEVGRWSAVGGSLLLVMAAALVAIGRRRSGPAVGALLVALHVVSQVVLLAPIAARERIAAIESAPRLTGDLRGGRWAHGRIESLFGPPSVPSGPSADARLLVRQGAFSALPFAGIDRGFRYELNPAPEGLDAFVTYLARDAVRAVGDRERVRLLSRWGVEHLVLDRPLSEDARVRLRRVGHAYGSTFFLYDLDAVASVRRVAGARSAADPHVALAILLDPAFDPDREVVIAGTDPPAPGGTGTVEVIVDDHLELQVVTSGRRPGFVVVERTFLPLYRAEVDGEPTTIRLANLHRIAIPVPEGAHRVTLRLDRRPLITEWGLAATGLLLLGFLALRARDPVVSSGRP